MLCLFARFGAIHRAALCGAANESAHRREATLRVKGDAA
jgi:hypothetical protein